MTVALARQVTGFIEKHGEKTEEMASVRPTLIIVVTLDALAAHQRLQILEKSKLWVNQGCSA